MISNELNAVMDEIKLTQRTLVEERNKAAADAETVRIYTNSITMHEKLIADVELKLDKLQIKLREVLIEDDKKFGIKGPTVVAPKEPEEVQIGREG